LPGGLAGRLGMSDATTHGKEPDRRGRRLHSALLGQLADLRCRIAPVATKGLQKRELAFLGSAGHGLGRHLQEVGHLGGMEVAGKLSCGLAAGLGCHGASLSCGGPDSDAGPEVRRKGSSGHQQGLRHAAGGHPAGRRTNRKMMQTDPTAPHSPIGLFQRVCYLVHLARDGRVAATHGTRPPGLHPNRRRTRREGNPRSQSTRPGSAASQSR
jgi:hypothetical protein